MKNQYIFALIIGLGSFIAGMVFGEVKPSVQKDCAKSIQQALDQQAAQGGGEIVLAAGQYRLEAPLSIPTGVTLSGVWEAPHHGILTRGTVLLVCFGQGDENGPAAIQLNASSALKNVTLSYPDQQLENVQPYPWTISGSGMHPTVENVTLVNSYNGILMDQHELHLIRNVFGCVLRRGILIDRCTDIGRIENVHFNPHYWPRSGHSGVPKDAKPNVDLAVALYMQKHLEAFTFARSDWQSVLSTFVFGAKTGYKFVDRGHGGCNGQFTGISADACVTCLQVEQTQSMGVQIVNGEFVTIPLRPEDDAERRVMLRTTSDFKGNLQLTNSTFWGKQDCLLEHTGPGTVSLIQGNARGWAKVPSEALIQIQAGRFMLKNYLFDGAQPEIHLGPAVVRAIISENFSATGMRITGPGAEKAIVRDNE